MDKDQLAALDRAATLRKLIADTAADVSAQYTYWTAETLADALIATGKLVLIDDGAVDRVARAIDHELVWEIETDVLAASLTREEQIKVARAALSALGVK